jgi:hypothetical protein
MEGVYPLDAGRSVTQPQVDLNLKNYTVRVILGDAVVR